MEPDDGSAINFHRSAYWTYVAMNSGLMCPEVSITQYDGARKSSFVSPTFGPRGQLDRDQSRQPDPGLVQLLAGGTRPGPIKSLFCNRVGQGLGAFDSDRPLSCIPDLQRRRASSHFDPGCENALDGTLIRFALAAR